MKLDLSREAHEALESAQDVIYEQMQLCCEQRDEATALHRRDEVEEIVVLINKLKQAQFALKELE